MLDLAGKNGACFRRVGARGVLKGNLKQPASDQFVDWIGGIYPPRTKQPGAQSKPPNYAIEVT